MSKVRMSEFTVAPHLHNMLPAHTMPGSDTSAWERVHDCIVKMLLRGAFPGDENFFEPFGWMFEDMQYPDNHVFAGEEFILEQNLEDDAQNFMTLIWLYVIQEHEPTSLSGVSQTFLDEVKKDLITISIRGL